MPSVCSANSQLKLMDICSLGVLILLNCGDLSKAVKTLAVLLMSYLRLLDGWFSMVMVTSFLAWCLKSHWLPLSTTSGGSAIEEFFKDMEGRSSSWRDQ